MKKILLPTIIALTIFGCASPKQIPITKLPKTSVARDYKIAPPPEPPGFAPVAPPPNEIPINTSPLTEYIRSNDKVNCFIGEDGFVFWKDSGQTNILPVTVDALGKSFELLNDSMVVAGYRASNDGSVSNYLIEYSLTYANDLPSAANMVYDRFFNDNGRWVHSLKTAKGGVVIVSFKWIGAYNIVVAYRSPAGVWSYQEKVFGEVSPSFIPSFDMQVQEGADGIHVFVPRDSSHNIAQIMLHETQDGIRIGDFRYDFLTDKCNFVGTQTICRDGAMTPNPEYLVLESEVHTNGEILLTYTTHDAIAGCNDSLAIAKVALVRVKTFPQPENAWCYDRPPGFVLQYGNPPYVSIVHQKMKTIPGVAYGYQGTKDGVTWYDIANLDTLSIDMIATGPEMSFRVFHPDGWAWPKYFFRGKARSYIRELDTLLQGYADRNTAYSPIVIAADGSVHVFTTPQTADCDDYHWRHWIVNHGTQTELPCGYIPAAWGCGWVVAKYPDGSVKLKRL